jgi:phosphoenolpyruvate synthase/pyruvate phosphate dikinase
MSKSIRWLGFFSRGQHPVLVNCLFYRAFKWYPRYLGILCPHAYKRDATTYFDRPEHAQIIKTIEHQLLYKPNAIDKCLSLSYARCRKALSLAKKYGKMSWEHKNKKKILKAGERLFNTMVPHFAYAYWPLWVTEAAGNVAQKSLEKIWGKQWHEKYIQATRPAQLTLAQKLRLTLLKAAVEYTKNKKLKELRRICERLARRYGHLRTYLFTVNPYASSDLRKEVKRILAQGAEQTLKSWQENIQEEQKQKRALLSQLPPQLKRFMEIGARAVLTREERLAWWGKIFTDAYPLFCQAAKIFGLSYEEFIQLTWDEFKTGKFNRTILKRRGQGYRFIAMGKKIKVTYPKIDSNKRSQNITEVKGIVVNQGKARGKAQFADAYSFNKLKPGVVVITAMTTPNAVPYLKGAKAIVTDEGGVTAHAAIFAREVGIPCIVGTRIATKVFKDGDMVEVDTEKGIVRLLK